ATLHAVATVLEQVGLRGASMAAHRLRPDYAIAIDGLSAGDTPDSSPTRDISVVMGRGPVVLLAASTGNYRGSIAHPAMKRYLLQAADAEGVPVQLATHLTRGSTEAASIHLSRDGIPTISIGVPRRYSYSPNEVVDLDDLAGAVQVLARFVRDMERHGDLGFLGGRTWIRERTPRSRVGKCCVRAARRCCPRWSPDSPGAQRGLRHRRQWAPIRRKRSSPYSMTPSARPR